VHRRIIAALMVGLVLAWTGCEPATTASPHTQTSTAASASASASPVNTATATPSSPGIGQAHWEQAGSMIGEHRITHAHALPDGRVVVIGEDSTAEIWDAQTGAWRATTGLDQPRTGFASVLLEDGRILVAGGLNDVEQSYSSAYLFDPVGESWEKAAGLMITARTNPSAVLLPDGRVLVAGGYFHVPPGSARRPGTFLLAAYQSGADDGGPSGPGPADIVPGPFGSALATAEIYDPATGQFSATGPMRYARNGAAVTALADGRIMVAGSLSAAFTGVEVAAGAGSSAEIYDPLTEEFTLAGEFPMLDLSAAQAAGIDVSGGGGSGAIGQLVSLADGGAALIGRTDEFKHVGSAVRSLRFDVASNQWGEIGETYVHLEDPSSGESYETPTAPRFGPAVAVLADGSVLVAGGNGWRTDTSSPTLASAEAYDPETGSWTALPDMPGPRAGATAVSLADGSVLLIGGEFVQINATAALTSAVLLSFAD
jgi:hypothetical protein